MIKTILNISQAKTLISNLKEKQLCVTVNLGRNKYIKYLGKLSGVYPALFTICPFDKDYRGKTSYSYSELLCGRVKVKEFNS